MKISKSDLVHRVAEYCSNYTVEFNRLTPREKEVMALWLCGNSSQTIAEKLGITKNTVLTHKKNVHKKTKLKSPKDTVLFALAFDLI